MPGLDAVSFLCEEKLDDFQILFIGLVVSRFPREDRCSLLEDAVLFVDRGSYCPLDGRIGGLQPAMYRAPVYRIRLALSCFIVGRRQPCFQAHRLISLLVVDCMISASLPAAIPSDSGRTSPCWNSLSKERAFLKCLCDSLSLPWRAVRLPKAK